MMFLDRSRLMKLFVLGGFLLFPIYVFFLLFLCQSDGIHVLLGCFVVAHALFRTWETFFTSKDRRRLEFHGDWTLALTTAIYTLLHFLFMTEFFFIKKELNPWVTFLGFAIYVLGVRMRIWGERALGKQWSIHAVGAKKIKQIRLLRIGPYKYIRHPIYTGIILDAISLPIILNTKYALVVCLVFFVPAMFFRALMEERFASRRFGAPKYSAYKLATNMFFPLKVIKDKFR
jgi:protein-S-isoprenylcysteine O-methyltransferase Ste14